MDLAAHVISSGWASGVNAYLTVAILSLLGRAGAVEVPEPLESGTAHGRSDQSSGTFSRLGRHGSGA